MTPLPGCVSIVHLNSRLKRRSPFSQGGSCAIMIDMSSASGLLLSGLLAIPLVTEAQSPKPGQPNVSTVENTAQLVGVLSELTELQKLSASSAPADPWQSLCV